MILGGNQIHLVLIAFLTRRLKTWGWGKTSGNQVRTPANSVAPGMHAQGILQTVRAGNDSALWDKKEPGHAGTGWDEA